MPELGSPTVELRLDRDGPGILGADTGVLVHDAAGVIVSSLRTGEPVAGVPIRFEVVSGPAALGEESSTQVDATTDRNGRAGVAFRLKRRGAAMLAARLTGSEQVRFFYVHTDQRSHALYLYADPAYAAQRGIVRVRISAVDHHENPVTRARLTFTGVTGADIFATGRVKEIGHGQYEASFQTHQAGTWTLIAEDRTTKVSAREITRVMPTSPSSIRIVGEEDPRRSRPFGEVTLRARLQDRFGNAHDPARIAAVAGNRAIQPHLVGEEAAIPVRFAGYGEVPVKLRDRDSEITLAVPVRFAAAWIEAPRLISTGSRFRTRLYWLPRPRGVTRQAIVRLRFDPKRAAFVSFDPPDAKRPALALEHSVAENVLAVTVRPKRPLAVQDYPDGICIGTAIWDCEDDGETCFVASAAMSPDTPEWELCPSQKESHRRCVCTNFIYPPDLSGAEAHRLADQALRQTAKVFNSDDNIGICCPLFYFQENFHALTAAEWNLAAGSLGVDSAGNPILKSEVQFRALDAAGPGKIDKCINIYLLPTDSSFNGITFVGPPGTSVINPAAINDPSRGTPPHEIGHAFGLGHDGDPRNVMYRKAPAGTELNKIQCQMVFDHIDSYPCKAI